MTLINCTNFTIIFNLYYFRIHRISMKPHLKCNFIFILCLLLLLVVAQRGGRSSGKSRSSSSSSSSSKQNKTCHNLFEGSKINYCTYIRTKLTSVQDNQTCISIKSKKFKCFSWHNTQLAQLISKQLRVFHQQSPICYYLNIIQSKIAFLQQLTIIFYYCQHQIKDSTALIVDSFISGQLIIVGIITAFVLWQLGKAILQYKNKIIFSNIKQTLQDPFQKLEIQFKKNIIILTQNEKQIILNRLKNQKFTMNGCSYHQDQSPFYGQANITQIKKGNEEQNYDISLKGKDNLDSFKMSGNLQFYGQKCAIQLWKRYDDAVKVGQTGKWKFLRYRGFSYQKGFWGVWNYERVQGYRYKGTWTLHKINDRFTFGL